MLPSCRNLCRVRSRPPLFSQRHQGRGMGQTLPLQVRMFGQELPAGREDGFLSVLWRITDTKFGATAPYIFSFLRRYGKVGDGHPIVALKATMSSSCPYRRTK